MATNGCDEERFAALEERADRGLFRDYREAGEALRQLSGDADLEDAAEAGQDVHEIELHAHQRRRSAVTLPTVRRRSATPIPRSRSG